MEKSEKILLQPMSKNEWIKVNPNKALISKFELVIKEKPPISNPFIIKFGFWK